MKDFKMNSYNDTDLLLKQYFLELDFDNPKNEKLMNMITHHYIGKPVIPTGFNFYLNSIIRKLSLGMFIALVSVGAYFIFQKQVPATKTIILPKISNPVNTNNELTNKESNIEKEMITTRKNSPTGKSPAEPSEKKTYLFNDTIKTTDNNLKLSPDNYKPLPSVADTGDYFPILTEKEIKENNKRKKKMIEQVAKQSKGKYALIPMGSGIYKNDTFSVRSFYMQTTEVSNIEYRTFLIDLLIQNRKDELKKAAPLQRMWLDKFKWSFNQPMVDMYFSHAAYDEYPVVNISRTGAEMYCKWLTHETNEYLKSKGKPFINDLRLPYDIEWAFAATGGYGRVKYATSYDALKNKQECYLQNYSGQTKDSSHFDAERKLVMPIKPNFVKDGALHTAKVNSYAPNNYGLYNMAGNVSEMVYLFDKKDRSSKKPGTKGGSWFSVDYYLEIDADEEFPGETGPSPMIGFRPVMTAAMND